MCCVAEMVWATTQYVGCSESVCQKMSGYRTDGPTSYVVCFYSPRFTATQCLANPLPRLFQAFPSFLE